MSSNDDALTERRSHVEMLTRDVLNMHSITLRQAWNLVRCADWLVTTPIGDAIDERELHGDCRHIAGQAVHSSDGPASPRFVIGVLRILQAAKSVLFPEQYTPANIHRLSVLVTMWHESHGTQNGMPQS